MTPQELHDLFRSDVVDTAAPYLWSEEEVRAYMNDAEKMLCRLTGGLADSTSSLTELEVVAGEGTAPFSNKILRVRSASLRSSERDVSILNYEDLTHATNARLYTRQYMNTPGPVCAIILGMDEDRVRIIRLPEEDDVIDMYITRLPLRDIDDESERFEVAEHHHLWLLKWMEGLAYAKKDSEAYDKAKSDELKQEFRDYCREVSKEKDIRKHKPRLMSYGGI